ncbi:MAG: NlpC/P60 family N-terminal domain-containing protein [Desulfotignum sp.]|nr:NlpC/P60 family N-terminal domain-containing protein [Desulfotignum sp.]
MKHRFLTLLFLMLFCLTGAGCAVRQPLPMADIQMLPQDAGVYLSPVKDPVIDPARQAEYFQQFKDRFFRPWQRTAPKHSEKIVFSGLKKYRLKRLYGENNRPLPTDFLDSMARQSQPGTYPLLHQPAVTVIHASIRVFPTHKPVFFGPLHPGRGFPFDMMQNSLVPAGTPVLVTHESKDRLWALVETDWVAGWVRWQEIAAVDDAFMLDYSAHPLAGFRADQVPVIPRDGPPVFAGRVGMALPMTDPASDNGFVTVLAPARTPRGTAELLEARVPENQIQLLPIPATPDHFADILNALMGQTYGWGGLYENRDCSALIQDLFAGFGIPLPRNSKDQADAGKNISLEGLSGPEKQTLIRTQGVPLQTLLYMPGHIMLYLGPDPASDQPVICHAMWGVTTRPPFSTRTGRLVIGRTVITTLEPGKEQFPLVQPEDLLVEKLTRMVLLN